MADDGWERTGSPLPVVSRSLLKSAPGRLEGRDDERSHSAAGEVLEGTARPSGSTQGRSGTRGSERTAEAEMWLWESAEEHLRLGFDSPEFWHAFNCWNWSYWTLLLMAILVGNVALTLLQARWSDGLRPHDLYQLLGVSTALLLGLLALWLVPLRGHTTMSAVVAILFASHYVQLWVLSDECHTYHSDWKFGCARSLILSEPPLFLVIFVFSTCRLRPLVPVLICGTCIFASLTWTLVNKFANIASAPTRAIQARDLHIGIASVFCCVACIFGAQGGASIFRRQRDIFEYLNDHLSFRRSPAGDIACEFVGIGYGTRNFFKQYINRVAVFRFDEEGMDDEEAQFVSWRKLNAQTWLRCRAHYLIIGIGGLTIPYLWISWDNYSRHTGMLRCASLQTAAMVVALASAIALKVCAPANRGLWATYGFMIAQLAFSVSFLYCGGVDPQAEPASKETVADYEMQGGVMPSDPFMFLVFTAHAILNFGVRRMVCLDIMVLVIFAGVMIAARQMKTNPEALDEPKADVVNTLIMIMVGHMLLTVLECLSLTVTLEKYDRILWKLHSYSGGMWDAPCGSYVCPSIDFHAGRQQDVENGSPSRLYRCSSRGPNVSICVSGFSAQYSDEVFYFIECTTLSAGDGGNAPEHGCLRPPRIALRSIPAIRAAFARLLERGQLDTVPFFECSFDALADATETRIWHAARRLEGILRRHLTNEAVAMEVLGLGKEQERFMPRLDVLLMTVGSRGDVQPFIALARALMAQGHRCRLAAHGEYESFVTSSGVEFYPLALKDHPEHWQPRHLMEHMEINPGMGPDLLLRPQDLIKMVARTPEMSYTMQQMLLPTQPDNHNGEAIVGPWAAAVRPDLRSGQPFIAQAIIANPPSFAHVHIAERLGIPCHLAFGLPWTQTMAVGHPLSGANSVQGASNAYWHRMSYRWVDNLQWSAGRLGSYINSFRREIGLSPIGSAQNAPSLVDELRVPFLYFYSAALLEKPWDWGPHIDITGFINDGGAAGGGGRPPALEEFLDAGTPPIYVGFGSISSDLKSIAAAVVQAACESGCRVVLQRGWGSLGDLPQRLPLTDIFYVGQEDEERELAERLAAGKAATGSLDHEWLFARCRAVCHHGGVGTSQCGMRHGRPTLVIAFFGDQPLWGGLMQHQGSGRLVLARRATASSVREAVNYVLSEEAAAAASRLQATLREEQAQGAGLPWACEAFHQQMPLELLKCDVCDHMVAQSQEQSTGQQPFVRLARFFDADSQLRLCDVCCYALFLQQPRETLPAEASKSGGGDPLLTESVGSATSSSSLPTRSTDRVGADSFFDLRPGRLAVYRALDWGRSRRRWLRTLGVSTISAMEGIVTQPFVGLRSGGLVGAAVGGMAGLLNLLAAPVTGVRHLARQVRQSVGLDPGAQRPGDTALRDAGWLYQDLSEAGELRGRLQLCRDASGSYAIGAAGSAGGLSPAEEANVCRSIGEAFGKAMAFHKRITCMQDTGHHGFASALANHTEWHSGYLRRSVSRSPVLSFGAQRRAASFGLGDQSMVNMEVRAVRR